MPGPFIEAQQFKGVFADPAKVAIAEAELAKPPGQRMPSDLIEALKARPAFTGEQSYYFKDGTAFDVQEDHEGQYLVLPPEVGGVRPRVHIGEWVCQLPSGKFIKLTDADYKAMTATGNG